MLLWVDFRKGKSLGSSVAAVRVGWKTYVLYKTETLIFAFQALSGVFSGYGMPIAMMGNTITSSWHADLMM